MDSLFSAPQLFSLVRIYFHILKVMFLGYPYTAFKVYTENISQHATDLKGVTSVVYHHSYTQHDLSSAFE